MSVVLMWVAFFGVLKLLGWLFYWRAEEVIFRPLLDMPDHIVDQPASR